MMKALPEARPRQDGAPAARYVTLDGMRGIAAIAVALYHFNIYLMPHGYVAVDFFFVLSGFVLYRSYLPRFCEGLGFGRFMAQRFSRLWPLFTLGTLLGAALALQRMLAGDPQAMAAIDFATTLVLHALMLPSPVSYPFYPWNVPSWSLMFEIVANIALFALIFRLPRAVLVAICVVSAVGMVPIVLDNGSGNIGALWGEHGVALMRTAFSFTLGVLIAMLPAPRSRSAADEASSSVMPRASSWLGVGCIVAIGMLLAMPVPKDWTAAYDLSIILFFSPLLVLLGSRVEPVRFAAPLAALTGEVSYALYAVHWSFIEPMRDFVRYTGLQPIPAATLFLTTMLVGAWAAVRWYDLPLRRRLTALLLRTQHGSFRRTKRPAT
jgi:peptidoglycan/LPS O-acetylase OafA/YrhL